MRTILNNVTNKNWSSGLDYGSGNGTSQHGIEAAYNRGGFAGTPRTDGAGPFGARNPAGASQAATMGNWADYKGRYKASPSTSSVARGALLDGAGVPPGGSGAPPGAAGASAPPAPANAASPYGTESGPGILEQWFNQRANGSDPAYEYAMKRGMNDIDSRMAAGGSFNSGARAQQQSDFAANMGAQRMGQMDALAGGASGEHQGRFNSMVQQMLGLAGGQSGTMGAYDLASANSNNALMNALVQMMANKAGVDQKSNQQGMGNILGLASLVA